jgi:hypothetical protein
MQIDEHAVERCPSPRRVFEFQYLSNIMDTNGRVSDICRQANGNASQVLRSGRGSRGTETRKTANMHSPGADSGCVPRSRESCADTISIVQLRLTLCTGSCEVGWKASVSSIWHVEPRSSRSGGWDLFSTNSLVLVDKTTMIDIMTLGVEGGVKESTGAREAVRMIYPSDTCHGIV